MTIAHVEGIHVVLGAHGQNLSEDSVGLYGAEITKTLQKHEVPDWIVQTEHGEQVLLWRPVAAPILGIQEQVRVEHLDSLDVEAKQV